MSYFEAAGVVAVSKIGSRLKPNNYIANLTILSFETLCRIENTHTHTTAASCSSSKLEKIVKYEGHVEKTKLFVCLEKQNTNKLLLFIVLNCLLISKLV